ncbi:MAG: threonylcarbamoyl-AMP synthase [candidate division Zixibacteria bacterium]|nr:threonylcarbamoyl-AMP synthase [candidate division Zixibacteria bacterium]
MTRPNIMTINPDTPAEPILKMAVDILRKDGILLAPTETRYGLLTRIDRPDTVRELYRMKRRRLDQPTAVFLKSIAEIDRYARPTVCSSKLAKWFLPGPMTVVLSAHENLPAPVTVDGKIGIRVSSSAVIAGLLDRIDFRLTATSANLSGEPEAETVAEIAEIFGETVPLYLDAGPLGGPPSTVVDCTGDRPVVLRRGVIAEEEINRVIGKAL